MASSTKRPLDDQTHDLSRPSKFPKSDTSRGTSCSIKSHEVEVVIHSRLQVQRLEPKPDQVSWLNQIDDTASPNWWRRIEAWRNAIPPITEDLHVLTFNEKNWRQCVLNIEPVDSDSDSDSLDGFEQPLDMYDSEDDTALSSGWLGAIDAFVEHTGPEGVSYISGICNSSLIRRSEMSRKFHQKIFCRSGAATKFGGQLFDRYGRLRDEFKHHPIQRGSGIWGDELDRGDILAIDKIIVLIPWRRQGIGRAIVRALLDGVRSETSAPFFAIVSPDTSEYTSTHNIPPEKYEAYVIALQFWRSLGFRRVGNTRFFAWASDATHRCHALPAWEDFDLTFVEEFDLPHRLEAMFTMLSDSADLKCLAELKRILHGIPETSPIWTATDTHGNTLLHLASYTTRPHCVKWLLNTFPKLNEMHNHKGEIPIESAMRHLRENREHSTFFNGHDGAAVASLYLLKYECGLNKPTSPDEELLLKFGCTCGKCIRGFISPRMRSTLHSHAKLLLRRLNLYLDLFKDNKGQDPTTVELPAYIRTTYHPCQEALEGFVSILDIIIQKLFFHLIPTFGLSGAAAHNYLFAKYNPNAVLVKVLEQAMSVDEWRGYPSGLGPYMDPEAELDGLPECRNDHEYELVARGCDIFETLRPSMAILRRESMLSYMAP
ncbi:hypothetical protein PT974_00997 [Cladobotryum mycophilum]|uniref:N-acetyltransferase domain-containing protein n=1 Tax=Cladobotryum mycophilum TaxID=491253 RepID=A0ABR0T3Q1_9HYPO